MKNIKFLSIGIIVLLGGVFLVSFFNGPDLPVNSFRFPYQHAGLTKRQAAAHLLDRFTYGSTPGQIDEVVNMGLETWFEQQLNGGLPDDTLNHRLSAYDAINLNNEQILKEYPQGFVVQQMAIKDSVISKDSVGKAVNKKAFNDTLQAYMKRKGFKLDQELYKQFISQKILRAAYTNNQLQEVLTDFWFNHFNVSLTKGECAEFIPAYERDVIRPNVLGKFDQLLMASAKSPAMLYYLDNFTSVGPPAPAPIKPVVRNAPAPKPASEPSMMMDNAAPKPQKPTVKTLTVNKNVTGLNENYAREVMELHTLGVDGGYTQSDVTQAARVLTGWTIYPISSYGYGSAMKGLVTKIGENNLAAKGFVHEGDFLFTPNRHDKGDKVVLGHHFDANPDPSAGYDEGVTLLEMLAHHPSAAKFLSRKLAVRFVSDNPSQSLVNKMAKTFLNQNGDIKQVLITMVTSPEFWNKKVIREKTKSPFELAMSSVRGLNANITQPYQLYNWISRMGQKIYYYQAPTGFPDRGQYWINTGSLLNRMNFGLALATQRIPGVNVNLVALNNNHEPESAQAALVTYSKIVMPERNLDKSIKQLGPLLTQPDLAAKVDAAAVKAPEPKVNLAPVSDMTMTGVSTEPKEKKPMPVKEPVKTLAMQQAANKKMLSQVVGIIIGSPEYQRR